MRVISLIGGIGSDKSYVADRLAEHGTTIADTDVITHEITASGDATIPKPVETFGTNILRSDGVMDRDTMRTLAFSDAAIKPRLEQITCPLIRGTALSHGAVAQASGTRSYLVYAVLLLVESLAGYRSWRSLVDRILVVDCSVDTQIARVMARDGPPRAQVEAIVARQTSRGVRLVAADDMIDNSGTLVNLLPQVNHLDPTYRSN